MVYKSPEEYFDKYPQKKEVMMLKYLHFENGIKLSDYWMAELRKCRLIVDEVNTGIENVPTVKELTKLIEAELEATPINDRNSIESQIIKYLHYEQNIETESWMPISTTRHSQEFYNFINSTLYGSFLELKFYDKFERYKAQCYQWLSEDIKVSSFDNEEERDYKIDLEFQRCKENTLYFLEKYYDYKEGSDKSGKRKWRAVEHLRHLLFLIDSGYSLIVGKPRQGYFTTTIGGYALKKALFQMNFFMKYISIDIKKGQEIFRDKIRGSFEYLPEFMKPDVPLGSIEHIQFGKAKNKGEYGVPNTRIETVAPDATAINGGSPQVVFIDEADEIAILPKMIAEARPTMFIDRRINGKEGELEMVRQCLIWSTGTIGNKGKGAYRREWDRILSLWEERSQTSGFVPVFYSWHVRCSQKVYDEEQRNYVGGKRQKGLSTDENKKMFAMHYPSRWQDMFIATSNTLVEREIIDAGYDQIQKMPMHLRPQAGYFEPVYDFSVKTNEHSDVPYKIVDAIFVPVDDNTPDLITAWRLAPPNYDWADRYFQGTDPIAVETGHSKMASVIWDEHKKAPMCIVNFRKQHDHKSSFLQCLLMGLYYDTNNEQRCKKGVPEVLESNIGTNYADYKRDKGFEMNMIVQGELPDIFRGGARYYGIDKKGIRAMAIIGRMREVIQMFYKNIYFEEVFTQLETFGQNSDLKNESWSKIDNSSYDDLLDALVYSYICSLCFSHKQPREKLDKYDPKKNKPRFRHAYDDNYNSILVEVRK